MAQWTLTDNSTGTPVVLTFDINPYKFSPPGRSANLSTQTTTAPNGARIMFQGYDKPSTASFTGRALTQSFYTTLDTWKDKGYPMTLTDDQGNTWNVIITGWKWERLKRTNLWAYEYNAEVTVL
jgi:hypothetical protein